MHELEESQTTQAPWAAAIARYNQPDHRKALLQVANTFLPFFGLWYLMYLASFYSYWLVLLMAVPAAGLRVRIFIIQHDCGHHSFFRSRRMNDWLGMFCSLITVTPYHFWKRAHARHHASSGNLDGRGHGDVGTLTVAEYLRRSRWGRWQYRLYRHPLVMFLPGACYLFMIQHRLTFGLPKSWRRERQGVHLTNLAILVVMAIAWWTIGLGRFLAIDLPIIAIGACVGTWLFYVQHQYEDAYWQPRESWDFGRAALEGSSYYRLPAVLQWFSGNIGFHHIHHLNSRIPNYHLPECYAAEPTLRGCVSFGLLESLRCPSLKLWDEDSQRLVGFKEAHRRLACNQAVATIQPEERRATSGGEGSQIAALG